MAVEQATGGPAFTAVEGTRVLGCAGIILPWPHVGMAWMCVSPELAGHGLWMTKMVKRVLDDTSRAYRLHRIEAVAVADSARNAAWLETLGFRREQEGRARSYLADGRDVIRYERVGG